MMADSILGPVNPSGNHKECHMVVTLLKRLAAVLLVSLIGLAGLAGRDGYSAAMETALTRELRETGDSILLQRSLGDHGPLLHTWHGTARERNP